MRCSKNLQDRFDYDLLRKLWAISIKSWYLYDLVVRQDCQKQGIATTILQPVLQYIEQSGQSCYLETHNTVNVDIYRKFGFDLMETGDVPGIHSKHYAMLKK